MASDESSMSSSSRLRQFGLYRSIDARTEEFLRLSRKRQLRQGCACAAASTAITVTVVIVIFFVYEFSLNSGTNLEKSLNSGWLSLMNDTAEDSPFDPKLTKANIDRTTLKLLPLLIKAIKKNAALEKLLDDHSNISPFYDKKDSKEDFEDSYEKNPLTHSWLKMPSTKLYAIEYKTSPVIYYKDPTKNIEYYTKIRKIRDYQRVFNYVDKMISEKVYIRSSKSMKKVESTTEAMFSIMSKTSTSKPSKFLKKSSNESKHHAEERNKCSCKCPNNLGMLLETFLRSIQNVLPPDVVQNEGHLDCKNKTNKSPNITTTIDNLIKLFLRTPVQAKHLITGTQTIKPTRTTQFKNLLQTFDDVANSSNNKTVLKENESSNNEKQLQSKRITSFEIDAKNILEHVFDDVEDINYTSVSNEFANKDKMPDAVEESMSLNDITSKKFKHIIKLPIGYESKNISVPISKNTPIIDLNVGHYTKSDNAGKEPSNKLNLEQTEDENITFDFVNSNSAIPENNRTDKINSLTTINETLNFGAPKKPAYFKYSTNSQDDKTIYSVIKHSLNSYLNKTSKTTPSLRKYDNMIESNKPKVIGTINKENKTNIYLLIENDVNAFLRKNISYLKAKLKKTKANLQKVNNNKTMQQTSNTLSTQKQSDNTILFTSPNVNKIWFRKNKTQLNPETTMDTAKTYHKSSMYNFETTELSTSLDPDDDGEFLISEITKPPENSIYKYLNDTLLHKKHQELTWEDLTNDFMPAWRSIIPEPTVFRTTTVSKPQHVEYHKTDDKSEVDQEEDFSLNHNFYDIIL